LFHNNGDMKGTKTWCVVVRMYQHGPWKQGENKLPE